MELEDLIPGKEYIYVGALGEMARHHGSTFVFENVGHLFTNMAMGKMNGEGYAVFPDELHDPEDADIDELENHW